MSVTAAAADTESRQFPYWRRNLRVLPLANLLCGLGFSLSWPFVPLMVRGLGVRENLETWVGYMLLVFYLISFAVNPIWGGIADHYGSDAFGHLPTAQDSCAVGHGRPGHFLCDRVPVFRDGSGAVLRGPDRSRAGAACLLCADHRAHARRPGAVAAHGKSRDEGGTMNDE